MDVPTYTALQNKSGNNTNTGSTDVLPEYKYYRYSFSSGSAFLLRNHSKGFAKKLATLYRFVFMIS